MWRSMPEIKTQTSSSICLCLRGVPQHCSAPRSGHCAEAGTCLVTKLSPAWSAPMLVWSTHPQGAWSVGPGRELDAAVYGVTLSRTQLKQLSSSSSSIVQAKKQTPIHCDLPHQLSGKWERKDSFQALANASPGLPHHPSPGDPEPHSPS